MNELKEEKLMNYFKRPGKYAAVSLLAASSLYLSACGMKSVAPKGKSALVADPLCLVLEGNSYSDVMGKWLDGEGLDSGKQSTVYDAGIIIEDFNNSLRNKPPTVRWFMVLPDLDGNGKLSPLLERCGIVVRRYDPDKPPEENLAIELEERRHPAEPAPFIDDQRTGYLTISGGFRMNETQRLRGEQYRNRSFVFRKTSAQTGKN